MIAFSISETFAEIVQPKIGAVVSLLNSSFLPENKPMSKIDVTMVGIFLLIPYLRNHRYISAITVNILGHEKIFLPYALLYFVICTFVIYIIFIH